MARTFDSTTDSSKNVGLASTLILDTNPSRFFALFVNDSDEVIYLNLGATATLHKGIRLSANGGSFELNETKRYIGQISAICSSGGKKLLVLEK